MCKYWFDGKNRFLKRKRYIFSKNKMTYVLFYISLGPLFVELSNLSCCLGSLNFYNFKTQQQTNNKLLKLENSGYVWTFLVNVFCYQSMFQIYILVWNTGLASPQKFLRKIMVGFLWIFIWPHICFFLWGNKKKL